MIWKWKSKPVPVVWDNPIAGDDVFQNPEIFLAEEKAACYFVGCRDRSGKRILPFKLFKFGV